MLTYHDRYGYGLRHAIVAEFWWRVEHLPAGDHVRAFGYRKRKQAEKRAVLAKGGVW